MLNLFRLSARSMRLLIMTAAFALLLTGCEEEKSAAGGGEGGGEGGGSGSEYEGENVGAEGPRTQSKSDKQRVTLNQLSTYLDLLINEELDGVAPETIEDVKAAFKEHSYAVSDVKFPSKDRWDEPLMYKKTGDSSFEIYSKGPDKQDGTEDDVYDDRTD